MGLFRWLATVGVAIALVNGTPTVQAQNMADDAMRQRVGDWALSCHRLFYDDLFRYGFTVDVIFNEQRARDFLAHVQDVGGSVGSVREYLATCAPVMVRVKDAGHFDRCGDLGEELNQTVDHWLNVLRDVESYPDTTGRRSEAQNRVIEEYLRTCVPVYAAALDGRHPDDVAAAGEQETTRRDNAASSAGSGPLHGSIAFSQDDDGAYAWGIAWSFDSSAGAEAEALGQCREYGGTQCAEAGWFQEACGALAIGDGNGYGTGWGATTGEAERDALAQCRAANDDCRIEVARCAQSEEAGGRGRQQPKLALDPSCNDIGAAWQAAGKSISLLSPRELPSCWREIAERSDCHVFGLYGERPASWSGECSAGVATGQGDLKGYLFRDDLLNVDSGEGAVGTFTASGTIDLGKKHGPWVFEYVDKLEGDATTGEGSFRDGVRDGRWVYRGQYGENVIDFDPAWIRQYPDCYGLTCQVLSGCCGGPVPCLGAGAAALATTVDHSAIRGLGTA